MSLRFPFLARVAGDFVRAGDLYYQRGSLSKAVHMYRRAERWEQAARVCIETGDHRGAVDCYDQAGQHLRAGELLAEIGDHKEAITRFERARAFDRAAVSSLALQNHQRAGQFFERAGMLSQAASCFEKAGEIEEAIRVLERESRGLEQASRSTGDAAQTERRRPVDLTRAGLLVRLGRLSEAAEIYLRLGLPGKAGEQLERAGELDRAARCFLEAGQHQRALEALDRATGLSALERARILQLSRRWSEAAVAYEEGGQLAQAAECHEAAGDWGRAAELWEQAVEIERAADLYFRVERWPDAARCFAAARRHDLAAQAFARIPDHTAAAASWLESGRSLEAAEHFLEAGDRRSASEALQQVSSASPELIPATLMLAPLLVEEGLFDGALHRLEMLPESAVTTGSEALERHYWQGRALEGLGRPEEALGAFQRVVALRRDHRDTTARIESMREEVRRAMPSSRTSSTWQMVEVQRSSAAAEGELRPGDVLAGRYVLAAELGRGGMGRVYKAEDRELGEPVAVKTVLSQGGSASADHDRLLREVQICRRITHPNVVRVHDVGRFDGGIFVTMEYLEGETLDRILKRGELLPLAQIQAIVGQVLAGLKEAHRLKIVHRDLKPSNILLTSGQAKILDFGIARMEGGDVDLTLPGEVLGSPKYMSPEQIQGQELDGRSDLYSLGIVLFVLLTGREPFTGKTASAIAVKQLRDLPPDIAELRPELSPDWRSFLDQLLDKEPARRWQAAEEALVALKRLEI